MKKTLLLFAFAATAATAQAQLTLPASPYTQNFDLLSSGLPVGWTTYTGATASSLGTIKGLNSTLPGLPFQIGIDTSCAGLVLGGGFKNFPSATVVTPGANFCPPAPATAPTFTNRALGVRQVVGTNGTFPNSDPGASFDLMINNTAGRTGFVLAFKLQSLDTASPRVTTWTVDYGFGATPTSFTSATTVGTMTTGGKTFSNNTINVNFGTALDNKSTPVHIRISALSATTGSGNRPSTAIDDFTLTYTGSGPSAVNDVTSQSSLSLVVLGNATSNKVSFQYSVEESATYNFSIYDLTGRTLHTETIAAKAGGDQISVDGLNLAPGMYFAKMNNGNSSSVAKIIVQ